MAEDFVIPKIEHDYKYLDEYVTRRKKQPYYWYKKCRMSAETICDIFKVEKKWFMKHAKIHGNQTANMIHEGKILLPPMPSAGQRKEGLNFSDLARISGISPATIRSRYIRGMRGDALTKPIENKRGQGRVRNVKWNITATKGGKVQKFDSVGLASISLGVGTGTIYKHANKGTETRHGWVITMTKGIK